jgi:hypothetical protein
VRFHKKQTWPKSSVWFNLFEIIYVK